MEIEAKLESIDSKIEDYSLKIDNLSSLITTLIHSFQQNQLPTIKAEILSKIEEKFQDSSAFPDVDEMKKVFEEIKDDFNENQNGLKLKLVELDAAIERFSSAISNISQNSTTLLDTNIQNQLNKIENILNSLSEEIASYKNSKENIAVEQVEFPTEKIDAITAMLTAQNSANTDFLANIENHFKALEANLTYLKPNESSGTDNVVSSQNAADIKDIKDKFDDLSLAITSVLSAIKIIDKKYTELKSFQDVIDKLTTDVVSPILLASNDIKSFVEKTSDNFEKLNAFVQEYDQGAFKELQAKISDVNIDVTKLLDLVNDFKTNSDLSNQAISDNMAKFEKMLKEYNENLAELTQSATTDVIKEGVKSLNDEFYLELLNLFNSLSFDAETEDIKDFIENVLSAITVKTDENTEKLNSIMLQFKNLLRKVEGIERAQNSISDYLKPEETDDLMYSFDDIQSDLAKMRLVLNDISKSVNTSELVDEISEKVRQTTEQIEQFSRTLGSAGTDNDENVLDIKEKIEELNSQVYDISLRTNKLILSNEDSNLELKNNLELFKDVFDKANPEKLYELFYELTAYFNDVIERINVVSQTSQEALTENITIKNALVYVGEWLDNATNVLSEIRDNSTAILSKENNVASQVTSTSGQAPSIDISSIINSIAALKSSMEGNLSTVYTNISAQQQNSQSRLGSIEENMSTVLSQVAQPNDIQNRLAILEENISIISQKQQELQAGLSLIDEKLEKLLTEKTSKGLTPSQAKNIDAKFETLQEVLAKISESITKE